MNEKSEQPILKRKEIKVIRPGRKAAIALCRFDSNHVSKRKASH